MEMVGHQAVGIDTAPTANPLRMYAPHHHPGKPVVRERLGSPVGTHCKKADATGLRVELLVQALVLRRDISVSFAVHRHTNTPMKG